MGGVAIGAAIAFTDLQLDWAGLVRDPSAWRADGLSVLLVLTAALFVVAGVLRLARWRLTRDVHSALVGAALVILGGLCLPLPALAHLATPGDSRLLLAAGIRTLACFVCMGLVVRAVLAQHVRQGDHPGVMLPLAFTTLPALFVALEMLGQGTASFPVRTGIAVSVLSGLLATGWLCVAGVAALGGSGPWHRRAVPLFVGLAIAELLHALDQDHLGSGTLAALLVGTAVAALAVRSAHLDLGVAVDHEQRRLDGLANALDAAAGQADELTRWREHLVHDATNAVAGLRAALTVLDRHTVHAGDPRLERLRLAAEEEVGHLEHLLTRSPDEPLQVFDVAALVREVGESAQTLGDELTLHLTPARAVGRPGDVVIVLKNLLANVRRHAGGSRVELTVEREGHAISIRCADQGPGLDPTDAPRAFERGFRGALSLGSGIGLHESRALMRAQGGDLRLARADGGACFVLSLRAAPERREPAPDGGTRVRALIPMQRPADPVSAPGGGATVVVGPELTQK